jgi:hydrophobe/amphiphile efflux-1 (HAE1) family protein
MSLSKLSVERPVLTTVFSLIIILVGVIAFIKLPVREYPDIDAPVVTVTTIYPGANPSVIESEVTNIIEEELTSIDGIKSITSVSREQVSSITIEFSLERSIDLAAQDVREKVARVKFRLPENTEDSVISKAEADAQPIMWLLVKSNKRNLLELSEYVDVNIKDYFQTINGVSKVIFGGEKRKSIQILIDPKQLAYYNLDILDLQNTLRNNNIELPGGRILGENQEYSIKIDAKLKTVEEYKDLIIQSNAKGMIRLRDVAQVVLGPEEDRSFVRFDGEQGFGLGIVRQSKANTVKISDAVRKQVAYLQKRLPEDIDIQVGFDAAKFIRLSLKDLYYTIAFSTLLVLIIIFVFLRNLKSTLVPAVSIPVSLIGVMGGLQILGFTVNLMTLLGLIIAVGIVVDDSIVVLENIYRKVEEGVPPKQAAIEGTKEVTIAVIATTLVLISIFLPVGFMTGITGRLLSEFAFSLCFATGISSFVALTMAPMLSSKLLKNLVVVSDESANRHVVKKTFISRMLDKISNSLAKLEASYEKRVTGTLKKSKLVVILSLTISIFIIVIGFKIVPQDFIPDEDRGSFLTIVQTRRGSNIDYLDEQLRKAENILKKIPEVETSIAVAAFGLDAPGEVTSGIIINRLTDWSKRAKSVFAIVGPLYPQFGNGIPEAFALPIIPKSGPSNGFGSLPVQIVLKSQDFDYLINLSAEILKKTASMPSLIFSKSDLAVDKPEIHVNIDRDKALKLGLTMQSIARTLEILFTGDDLTEFNESGEEYKVIARLPRRLKNTPDKILELAVKNNQGELIQLSSVLTLSEQIGIQTYNHYNRRRAVTIEAAPRPGITPASALAEIEAVINKLVEKSANKPIDFELDYKGTSKDLKENNLAIYISFVIALMFAYLFLAGQFESFKNPLVIMTTVPLALAGAVIGILVFMIFPLLTFGAISLGAPFWIRYVIPQFSNISLNIYSQVGMIMLIGMASKNGILMVEFIDQLKRTLPLKDAVISACKLRLRPILMTAFSTILGILPIALALGVGSQSRQALGIVIVFGMLFSTILTLFVVPSLYYLFNKTKATT